MNRHEAFMLLVLRGSSGSPLNTIQLSVNFGVAISPRHECASTFTDIMPSYLVFLEYLILIHKKAFRHSSPESIRQRYKQSNVDIRNRMRMLVKCSNVSPDPLHLDAG